jgi:outer membrane protein assembly factor BamB
VAAGVAAALAGVVVALVANLPGGGVDEYQRTGERNDPDPWLARLAIGLALACLVWLWTIWTLWPERWVRWLAASAAMAAGGVAALVVVTAGMPAPGPDGGPDLSFRLMQLAAVAVVLGVLTVAVGGRLRRPDGPAPPGRRARTAAGAGSAGAAATLVAALAVLVVPAWAATANTSATTASLAAPEDRPPALDGTVAWSVTQAGAASDPDLDALRAGAAEVTDLLGYDWSRASLIGTAGGLAVLEQRGVRVLDPATGARRWSHHRWDARHFGPRHTPDSAHTGTAAVSPDGRWLAMTMFIDATRSLLIDGLRDRTRVWVFDTASGAQLVDAPVPDSARVVAVDRDLVAITSAVDDEDDDAGRVLSALGRDGRPAWRHPLGEGCGTTDATTVDGDLLVLLNDCADRSIRLLRVHGGTGSLIWTWQAEASLGRAVSMVVAGSTTVVDLYDGSHHLAGVSLADGAEVWRRPIQSPGRSPDPGSFRYTGRLHAVAGTVVFAEQRDVVVVHAVDAATGEVAWTGQVADGSAPVLGDGRDMLLEDGRFLLAYADATDHDRCVLGVWDSTTGVQRDRLDLRAGGYQPPCGARSMLLVAVPGAVVAWQPNPSDDGQWLAVLR